VDTRKIRSQLRGRKLKTTDQPAVLTSKLGEFASSETLRGIIVQEQEQEMDEEDG